MPENFIGTLKRSIESLYKKFLLLLTISKEDFPMKHTVKILALFIIVGLAGCASNKDLDAVKLLAQQANATAEEALKTARNAENTAQEANTMSNSTANALERMAQDKKQVRK